jgi:hypothetical protein
MDAGYQNTVSGLLRPARAETFEHTITGLLARAELFVHRLLFWIIYDVRG